MSHVDLGIGPHENEGFKKIIRKTVLVSERYKIRDCEV
jgi:hypothetical protein